MSLIPGVGSLAEDQDSSVVISRAPCPGCGEEKLLDGFRISGHYDPKKRTFCKGVGADARPNLAWRYTVLLRRTARAIAESRDRLDDGDGLSDSGKKRLLDRVDRLEREQQIRRRELAAIGCSDILEQHDAAEQRRTRARLPRQGRR